MTLAPKGIFDPSEIQKHVDAALGLLPPGKQGAFVTYATLSGKVQETFIYRSETGHIIFGATLEADLREKQITGDFKLSFVW